MLGSMGRERQYRMGMDIGICGVWLRPVVRMAGAGDQSLALARMAYAECVHCFTTGGIDAPTRADAPKNPNTIESAKRFTSTAEFHFLKKSPALKALLVVLIGLGAITLFVGKRWYDYVSKAKSPYEEIGIELNSRAPGPLNRWGCAQLQERFAKSVPPYGCAVGDGRQWK